MRCTVIWEVVKNIEVYGEMHRYMPYLAKNAGFDKIAEKPVHHESSVSRSSWAGTVLSTAISTC